jgi:protein-disulfide isomerase-like protein with CxxC motif
MMARKKQTLDAVRMVRTIRDQHYEETKDTTTDEWIAFYREKAERLHRRLDEEADSTSS